MTVGNLLPLQLHNALSLLALALFIALISPAHADPVHISGVPGITDGDTIRIGADRIRLFGIDAPERDQSCTTADGTAYACGDQATKALADFIGGRELDCEVVDVDRYGRAVAVCLVGGVDINGWLVSQGWALAYRRYSMDYVSAEDRARAAKVGLWGGSFVVPWEWRNADN